MDGAEHRAQPPGTGDRGNSGQQENRAVSPNIYGSIERILVERLHNQRRATESAGGSFNPVSFTYDELLKTSAEMKFAKHSGFNVPDTEADRYADEFRKIAVCFGMLGYAQFDSIQQRNFRKHLHEEGYIALCDEAQAQWKQKGFIDWDQELVHDDHRITLPEDERQLLKRITGVVGVPYNPEQATFYFSTILNQPEPIVSEENT